MGMWKGYNFRAGLGSGGWCRGRGDGGRRSRSVEQGCSWGCLNCSAPRLPHGLGMSAGLSHRSPAASQQAESVAGKGICWGRMVDGDCLGGSWASDRQREAAEPQLHQPVGTHSEET